MLINTVSFRHILLTTATSSTANEVDIWSSHGCTANHQSRHWALLDIRLHINLLTLPRSLYHENKPPRPWDQRQYFQGSWVILPEEIKRRFLEMSGWWLLNPLNPFIKWYWLLNHCFFKKRALKLSRSEILRYSCNDAHQGLPKIPTVPQ